MNLLVLLLVLVIIFYGFVIRTKLIVIQGFFNQKENVIGYVDSNENLREYYLEKYLLEKFYEKYTEKSLNDKIRTVGLQVWKLDIDSINLSANINSGTDENVLNEYIGHFDETNIFNGNVGLAAHNRGYPVNYFENLDKVKIGDYIYYTIDDFVKKYKVISIQIIEDTDWTYLEETDEDTITLITCVRNKPNNRLCVQAHKESEDIINNAEKNISSRYGNSFIIKCNFSRKC